MFSGMIVSILIFISLFTLSGIGKCIDDTKSATTLRDNETYNIRPMQISTCGMVAQILKLRHKYYQTPVKPHKNKNLVHLAILLLAISCDIESNPGPDYPCGSCGSEVTDSDPAVECDSCMMWFHLKCQGLENAWYQQLLEREQSFVWSCTNCDRQNHSNISSILSTSTNNSFSILDDLSPPDTPHIQPKTDNMMNIKNTFPPKLKLLCINCQSVVNKKHELQTLIQNQKPDIICATESWLRKDHFSSEIFPPELGYTVFRRDRESGKGGGVFILVKNNLLPSEMPTLKTDCEILWVKIKIKGSKPLLIAVYYRPHESDMASLLELEKSLQLAQPIKGTKIILGDFNFPKIQWDNEHTPSIKSGYSTHPTYDKFLEIIDDNSLTQMVKENTRGQSVLDLILTTNHTLVNRVDVIAGISDHDVVSASINLRPSFLKQKPRTCHLYKKADWPGFRVYARDSVREIFCNKDNFSVHDLWAKVKFIIEDGISKYVPIKKIGSRKSLPWVTHEIKKLIHKRDQLYRKTKANKENHELWKKFKGLKAKIKSKIKLSYNQYLEDLLDISDTQDTHTDTRFSCKKLFTLLKNSKQDSQSVSPLKDQNTGTLKTDNKDKANILNRQFQSVFSGITPLSLGQTCMQNLRQWCPKTFSKHPKMDNITINSAGVLKLLANLKPNKAAGPDQIRPVVLKELRHELTETITLLFQKSLDTGTVPLDWTKANVCPIYKKGDTSNPANYRPISLTCILCKTLEHIVASHLSSHFTKHNILYDLQHGFRERRSCETQLIELTDHLINNISAGKQTDLILLDFSKAFDKVNHQKLLFLLQEYGVSPQILDWTRSFLVGRSQTVVLDGESSTEVPVTSGVPQGSVLGPLCFLVYINQLPSSISKSQVRLFADDTAIYLTINSLSDSKSLQEDLDVLQNWERDWDMEFNPSKCQVLHVTRNKKVIKHNYFLHGQALVSVSDAKYLGLDLSTDLNFNTHISRITTTANRTLGFIKRNVTTTHQRVRELAYKSLVRPQLEYASAIWSPYTKVNIEKVERVQRRAIRWVRNDYTPLSSVTFMQDELGWHSLERRRQDARLIMFYKIYHNIVAIHLPSYIQPPVRFTRHMHPLSLRQVQVTSDYHKFSFFPHSITLWNQLPAHIATLTDLDQFKRAVVGIQY